MDIDWALFARYAAPIATLFIGAALNRYLERRPKLISFLAHASAVAVQPPNGAAFNVHTHSIVVRNAGGKPATNVRLGHLVLPTFSVWPQVAYHVDQLPSGGAEIVFPSLVPGEQVTVNYLYSPPTLWSDVNTHTKSDEGFARIVTVLPTPQLSPWVARIAGFLMVLGGVTTAYVLVEIIRVLVRAYRGA